MKTRLTKEQTQHLFKLGVPKTMASDSIREYDENETYPSYLDHPKGKVYPIFTLTDLLEIFPKEMEVEDENRYQLYNFTIEGHEDYWEVSYYTRDEYLNSSINGELIDALYEFTCWYYGEFLKEWFSEITWQNIPQHLELELEFKLINNENKIGN